MSMNLNHRNGIKKTYKDSQAFRLSLNVRHDLCEYGMHPVEPALCERPSRSNM